MIRFEAAVPGTGPQSVRWVVTNTGATWLTEVVIADVTDEGPALSSITCTFPDGTSAMVDDGDITCTNPSGCCSVRVRRSSLRGRWNRGANKHHQDHVDGTALNSAGC